MDSISIHEAKGEGDKKSRGGGDQIGSSVSFRAAGRAPSLSVGYVA